MLISSGWKFAHAGLIVRDCEQTTRFYRDLGFDIISAPYVTPPKYADNAMSSRVSFVGRGGLLLEIMQPLDGQWVIRDFLDSNGEGINHICFEVADIESERERLESMGFPVIYGFSVELGTFKYFDTRRQGNIIVELLQPSRPGAFADRVAASAH